MPPSYVDALCREIKVRSSEEGADGFCSWKSVYIGGGTPSLLTENQLKKIFAAVSEAKKIESQTEITIEVNPDDVTEGFIEMLNKSPVNRLSVGIQSLNEKSLSFAKRRASACQNLAALECISKKWKGRAKADITVYNTLLNPK